MVALLNSLGPNEILFVDEIHRLAPAVAEVLYPAMEDHYVDIMVGEKLGAHSLRIDLPPFTLIGATTRADLLTGPLRDRFPLVHQLEFYSVAEVEQVLLRAAEVLRTRLEPDAGREIAVRARGTPRVANNLLRRVRDYAEVRGHGAVDRKAVLALLEIAQVMSRVSIASTGRSSKACSTTSAADRSEWRTSPPPWEWTTGPSKKSTSPT